MAEPTPSAESTRRASGMRPEQIELLVEVGPPAISPDGAVAVFSATHPDLGADAAVGQLWRVALPGGTPGRLTRGFHDSDPRFSPDGTRIAFLRSTRTGPGQLMVMPADGGEPVVATDARLGVSAFDWSPDGTRIAYVARDPEPGRYGSVEGLDAAAEPPRRFTTFKYRANGVGVTTDRPARLFLVDAPDPDAEPTYEQAPQHRAASGGRPPVPEPRRLTSGDQDVAAPAFAPDGSAVLVIASLHESRDTDLVSDLYRVPLDGGEPERLTDGAGAVDGFAADGGGLWTIGGDLGPSRSDFVGRSGVLSSWQDGVPRHRTDAAALDLGDGPAPVVVGDAVLAVRRRRGRGDLVRITPEGGVAVLTQDVEVLGIAAAGGRVVVSVATPESTGELALVEEEGLRLLTGFGAAVQRVGPAVPTELVAPARDGAEVHGWVTVPSGPGPHPVLLMIHGGPFSQYSVHLFDETQVLVGAGYAVVQCNPRGSAGYGEEHGRAIRQRMGTVDLTDVIDFLDHVVGTVPGLDGTRVGVLGGSYGGYLTAWITAHDHRFAAAIVERGFLDPEGFVGTSDIGSFFGDEYVGTDPERVRAQSPQAAVGAVRTPTLVLHSEQDLRCPLPQAERYSAALRRNGVATELLVFPGEDHELSRSGRPRHRVQRFEAILDWWHRYLPV